MVFHSHTKCSRSGTLSSSLWSNFQLYCNANRKFSKSWIRYCLMGLNYYRCFLQLSLLSLYLESLTMHKVCLIWNIIADNVSGLDMHSKGHNPMQILVCLSLVNSLSLSIFNSLLECGQSLKQSTEFFFQSENISRIKNDLERGRKKSYPTLWVWYP